MTAADFYFYTLLNKSSLNFENKGKWKRPDSCVSKEVFYNLAANLQLILSQQASKQTQNVPQSFPAKKFTLIKKETKNHFWSRHLENTLIESQQQCSLTIAYDNLKYTEVYKSARKPFTVSYIFREATKSYIRGTWVWTLNSAIYLNQEKSVSSIVIMASSVVIMESKRIAWCGQPRGPQLPFSQWRNSVVMLLIVGFTSLTFFVFTKHLSKVIQFIQRSKYFAYFWMVELTSANKANWTAWLKSRYQINYGTFWLTHICEECRLRK